MITQLKRLIRPKPAWFKNIKTTPVSSSFGLDRGTPVDRYYIEHFLSTNSSFIKGRVLEIAESTYSKKYGHGVTSFEVLHVDEHAPNATIIGDLTNVSSLPEEIIDCFICTQTLNFIYDVRAAITGIHKLLKPGGVALITVACLTQISRYDSDRWGDFWRFTPMSIHRLFQEVFEHGQLDLNFYGNVYAATAIMQGLCVEELNKDLLLQKQQDYPVTVVLKVKKNNNVS